MTWIASNVWLIPLLPLLAAGITSLFKRSARRLAAALAIGSMSAALLLSCAAMTTTLGARNGREYHNFDWLQTGAATLQLGWVLDPLAAVMLVMVSFVGLLIFVYSVGYMAQDENFTRFFCFLSLFAAAMLGLVIANNLLLLFICWELVGLASYLLIGFWYHKPSAALAARKAFVTTRIGDLGFFLGLLWLYTQAGTLVFYDGGRGCLEGPALVRLVAQTTLGGMAVSTAISLLIFCGAIGKSGQVPLHVWLPDAMEGPTPVSALIHAATMVAAGVFLVARVYPLMQATAGAPGTISAALQTVAWVGAVTGVFAALIAVAQTDIKRILAYSTVSQLGLMMLGLGVGGVAVGMFHLLTHAFFKALLFLGAGSVIHGCHEEQDIRRLGGLRRWMPLTFATYAVGMMALAGVPLFFSGFWSKDGILHAAHQWPISQVPFLLGSAAAVLTAFYMTRQMFYVFAGPFRGGEHHHGPTVALVPKSTTGHAKVPGGGQTGPALPHESPPVMTIPLVILGVFALLLGFVGTPAWPWLQSFLEGGQVHLGLAHLAEALPTMAVATVLVAVGIGSAWWLYGRRAIQTPEEEDALQKLQPALYSVLRGRFFVDEFYAATVIRLNSVAAVVSDLLDRWVWGGVVKLVSWTAVGFSHVSRLLDDYVVNAGFDAGCRRLSREGKLLAALQDGQVQHYLCTLGAALAILALWLIWGGAG